VSRRTRDRAGRLDVAARTAAGVLGGYALASLVAASCAAALPSIRSEAVLTGMLLGLLVAAGALMWAFAARSALHAWAWIAGPAAVLALGLLAMRGAG
jgi:hypothetical protein